MSQGTNVRYGSKADSEARPSDVCFTSKADIDGECLDVRFANSRHSDRFWILLIVGKGAQIRGASPVKLPRREFLHLTAGTAALPVGSRFAWAQAYPSRPVRIVVGSPPGT